MYESIGIDEAGRGPLAGPVVVAAVRLPRYFDGDGLNDSKQLTFEERTELETRIRECCTFAVVHADHEEIDRVNILRATLNCMARAHSMLGGGSLALVDGNQPPPIKNAELRCEIDGDARFLEIAAASILAKNTRDRIMRTYARRYPGYGFETNFGYSTPAHLRALKELGPCPIHRKSFSPIAQMLAQPCLSLDT